MRFKIKQTCPYCHGFGYGKKITAFRDKPIEEKELCTSCNGTGSLTRWWDIEAIEGLEEYIQSKFIIERKI